MAFTGVAVVKKVSDRLFRITGLSLAGAAAGTIGFSDKTAPAEVSLVAPQWQPYLTVTLQDAIECWCVPVTAVVTLIPISVVKTGTTHLDFALTLTNTTAATASATLEIWVEFH